MEKKTYIIPKIKTLLVDGDDLMQVTSPRSMSTRVEGGTAPDVGVEKGTDDGTTPGGAKGSSFGDGLWD